MTLAHLPGARVHVYLGAEWLPATVVRTIPGGSVVVHLDDGATAYVHPRDVLTMEAHRRLAPAEATR